jgi:NhaP-type Na+/H+ or K+/H+ antiporter
VTTAALVMSGLAWSAAGGLIGYVIGSMVREGQRRRWQEWARTLFGLLILSLVAYTAVATFRINECQSARNAAFAAGLAERSEAARDERAAQREFLLSVRSPDKKARDEAFARYLRGLDAADARRDAAAPLDVASQECV